MQMPPKMFSFTKLVVQDLEKTADFYKAVFGLTEMARVDAAVAGRKISEILFQPPFQGAANLILFKFLDREAPAQEEVILGFIVDDLDAMIERAKAAGGAVVDPPYDDVEHGVRVAFVTDVEGHLMEVVQLLAPAQ